MNPFRAPRLVIALALLTTAGLPLPAGDPPHSGGAGNIQCVSCHKLHGGPGGALTTVTGNSNLCLSCHMSGGLATNKVLVASDQAVPADLTGSTAGGTSHRWDSGPQGRLVKGTPNTSTGTVTPSGAYTGAFATTVELKITTAGAAGVAKFDWRQTAAGTTTFGTATTGIATSTTATALGTTGVSLAFSATGTFVLNDIFYLYLRSDLRNPTSAAMASKLENGRIMCSSCHDQHLQALPPFDPAAPQTYTAGTTTGRHFQRVRNDDGSLCGDCHAPRNVGKGGSSHPVNVNLASAANTKTPSASLVLSAAGNVQCLSCHKVHGAPTATTPAGMLLRASNSLALCTDCHTLADTTTANTHTNPTSGILWPGDQYGGSTYPAVTNTADRGACKNCHTPHGWPDANNPGQKYAGGFGARQDNLCLTCHDGTPAKDVNTQIVKSVRHPVARTSGSRTVGCGDCHNPHMAIPGVHAYATTATVDRNRIRSAAGANLIGSLRGVDGVAFNFGSLGLWAAPAPATFTKISSGSPSVAASGAEFEYQVCFKCHTSYDSAGATRPGGITNFYSAGTAKFTNASTAVAGTGTTWTAAMVGMYIQKNISSPAYRISAFVSATSLTLATAYAGPTDAAAAAYTITKQQTDLAQEFNPANRSGHPVVTGLNNYTGSTAPKALAAVTLKAPWNTNMGTQTMLCSDCHNTDAASPAAQGPHGSAAQFMLRGTNPANWPNTTLSSASTSWCTNCHTLTLSNNKVHSTGNHSGYQCYRCHVVIPHGSKRSRLIGDRTNMPARYAYNNLLTNMDLTQFKKATTPGGYSESNCGVGGGCYSGHGTVTGNEVW